MGTLYKRYMGTLMDSSYIIIEIHSIDNIKDVPISFQDKTMSNKAFSLIDSGELFDTVPDILEVLEIKDNIMKVMKNDGSVVVFSVNRVYNDYIKTGFFPN